MQLDPQGCFSNKKKCAADYGIGQVRIKVWQKAFPIDKTKILTDTFYSVNTSVKVLAEYKRQYGHKELNWYTRYHSKTPEHRQAYMKHLNKAFAKINAHLKNQEVRSVAGSL